MESFDTFRQEEVITLAQINIKNLQLTDNTLENIKLMAPYLDEKSQEQVYGVIFGIVMGLKDEPEKAG